MVDQDWVLHFADARWCNMLPSTSLIISPDDEYSTVDATTISRFACTVRRCFSYAPNRMYFRRQNGHLLGMVGVSSVYIVSYM